MTRQDAKGKSGWQTFATVLGAIATLIAAVATLMGAFHKNDPLTNPSPGGTASPSSQVADTLDIPARATDFNVFLQDRHASSAAGCEILGQHISRDSLQRNFEEFRNRARQTNRSLIITASVGKDGAWVHDSIRYKGQALHSQVFYWCYSNKPQPGAEVPLK